jgi:hypothetical protein
MSSTLNPYQRRIAAEAARKARPKPCPACGVTVLVGLNNDICAWTVAVDPTPLTHHGELLAVLSGRTSYALRNDTLHHRPHDCIKTEHQHGDVVTDHKCDQPIPVEWRAPTATRPNLTRPDDQPGF